MKGRHTIVEKPATPEQILGVLQNWHRLQGLGWRESELLTFDSSMLEFELAFDVWDEPSEVLNAGFGLSVGPKQWKSILRPRDSENVKLKQLCEFIAARTTLPCLNELSILGKPCRNGSAFLAVRQRLEKAGLNVNGIRPSSKLDETLRRHSEIVLELVSKLVPGRLPDVSVKSNLGSKLNRWMFLMFLVGVINCKFFGSDLGLAINCVGMILALIGMVLFNHYPPTEVQLAGCETFADISRLIASEPDKLRFASHS